VIDAAVTDAAVTDAAENAQPPATREGLLARLRGERAAGRPLLVASAGNGLIARCALAGGADAAVVYSSGRFRAAGLPSLASMLPIASANEVVLDLLPEVAAAVPGFPLLAGVCAADPFAVREELLAGLRVRGVCGIQNFPSVGLIDGRFRAQLEESGLGFAADVSLMRAARAAGFFTAPFVFDTDTARAIATASPDAIVVHAGVTAGGAVGVETARAVDECARLVERLHEIVARELPEVLVLFHGGAVADATSLGELLRLAPMLDGFVAASAIERLPVERAVAEATHALKNAGTA
jgi:predicted TIM-barrel enzyme